MSNSSQDLTTQEFSKKTGISTSTITKMIRDGRIKAKKISRKWMIPQSELENAAAMSEQSDPKGTQAERDTKTAKPAKADAPIDTHSDAPKNMPQAKSPSNNGQTYSVAEFSKMTFLTEFGVKQWLKKGKLEGVLSESGEWKVLASNLDVPNVKRLLR